MAVDDERQSSSGRITVPYIAARLLNKSGIKCSQEDCHASYEAEAWWFLVKALLSGQPITD